MRLTPAMLLPVLLVALVPARARAQRTGDPLHSERLTVGGLAQVIGEWAEDSAADGFSLGAVRVKVFGALDGGVSYAVQASLTSTPTVIDARLSWTPVAGLRLDAGRFKSPFTAEYLRGAADLDFSDRARIVQALATGRQVGAAANLTRGALEVRGGVFSGERADAEDAGIVATARAALHLAVREGTALVIGASAAAGEDEAVLPDADTPFDGRATLLGADARLTSGPLLLDAEALRGDRRGSGALPVPESGVQVTAGWHATRRTQLLLRWDRLDGSGARDTFIAGLNLYPTPATRILVNAVLPAHAGEAPRRGLVKLQVAF